MNHTRSGGDSLIAAGEAAGPHGSSAAYILDPAYSPDWTSAMLDFSQPNGVTPNNLICTKCHIFSANSGQPKRRLKRWSNGLLHERCRSLGL